VATDHRRWGEGDGDEVHEASIRGVECWRAKAARAQRYSRSFVDGCRASKARDDGDGCLIVTALCLTVS
jgi:hypothetical protein